MNTKHFNKGFTIIEVVLVLAIAGLIFLMVFIALPALQSGQRDTARKTDVGSVATAVSNYTANNRGAFPTTAQLTDPNNSGAPGGYTKAVSTNTTSIAVADFAASIPVTSGQIIVVPSATCGDTGAASQGSATQKLAAGTARQFVVITYLEGGSGTSFCQDS
ncbi:MAG TPA: type II secretion system protein [Dongiaceae bacterium]|nr:type II secretion system protein [Dongiaceae bacterium]